MDIFSFTEIFGQPLPAFSKSFECILRDLGTVQLKSKNFNLLI
jgi:hypothetical protein